MLAANNVLI